MRFIDETPPLDQPQRFGNKAYRLWSDRVRDVSNLLIPGILLTSGMLYCPNEGL